MGGRLDLVGASCGLASPIVFLALYIVAMAGDERYEFFSNYLSDLGVGEAAWAFNAAVMAAGALMWPFLLLGLRPALGGSVLAELGVAAGLGGATFLVLLGVFTEDYDPEHYLASLGFFLSMEVALGFLSWSLHSTRALGREAALLTQGTFALGAVLIALGFNPQTETVSVLALVVWGLVVSAILLRRAWVAPTP